MNRECQQAKTKEMKSRCHRKASEDRKRAPTAGTSGGFTHNFKCSKEQTVTWACLRRGGLIDHNIDQSRKISVLLANKVGSGTAILIAKSSYAVKAFSSLFKFFRRLKTWFVLERGVV
jgi:hypothetical protein